MGPFCRKTLVFGLALSSEKVSWVRIALALVFKSLLYRRLFVLDARIRIRQFFLQPTRLKASGL